MNVDQDLMNLIEEARRASARHAARTATCGECGQARPRDPCEECRVRRILPALHRDAVLEERALAGLVTPPHPFSLGQILQAAVHAAGRPRTFITGPTRSGKTTLAAAMLRSRLDVLDTDPVYVESWSLAKARIDAPRGSEPHLVRRCRRAPLLVLDELGRETTYDETIVEVLKVRHRDRRQTIIVSPFDPRTHEGSQHLVEKYDAATYAILVEGVTHIRLEERPTARAVGA
jgi:hypothetical protein